MGKEIRYRMGYILQDWIGRVARMIGRMSGTMDVAKRIVNAENVTDEQTDCSELIIMGAT